jgi:Rrf2 family protein
MVGNPLNPMITLTKRTDYALMAVAHLAGHDAGQPVPARDIAGAYEIPAELMAKILQKLARSGLLVSSPGPTGGYSLARPAESITVGEVVEAVEGGPALAQCMRGDHADCEQSKRCTIRGPLARINARMLGMLDAIPVSELMRDDTGAAQVVVIER